MTTDVSFHVVDYVVIATTLIISLAIGVLFAVKDFRLANRDEYLLGGRRMFMIPVALSMFATFTSGISVIGAVTDVYMYGLVAPLLYIGMSVSYLIAAFTLVPLFYPLRLTSIYEYLQLRFDSTVVRKLAVLIGMFQTLLYMSFALLSPALALQTGAQMQLWMSIGVVGFIGTVYSAMGGIKSVVWTDAFQTLVMLGSVLTIIIIGTSVVGGGSAVWEILKNGDRLSFFDFFNPDPRSRNTLWSSIIAGSFFWIAGLCNQSTLQRISAMTSMKDARGAFIINGMLTVLLCCLILGLGMVVYAYFVHISCDPFQAGLIFNANQISPYFVMSALKYYPGIGGIYVAMIFSASLSTLSSGISALAAITVEDLLKKQLENFEERTATTITKALVFLYGILIIGLAYGANSIGGPLTQMVVTIIGACSGPVAGIFILGALIPWANKYGAVSGCVTSAVFVMWIALGNKMYGVNEKPLPPPPTDMCFRNNSVNNFTEDILSFSFHENSTIYSYAVNQTSTVNTSVIADDPRRFGFFLYDISFEWYGCFGILISFLVGVIISYFTQKHCESVIDEKLLFPFVRKFWLSRSSHVIREKCDEEVKDGLMVTNSTYDVYAMSDTEDKGNHDSRIISPI